MSKQEPKAHVIDGVTYVEVDRAAKVGDKVIRNEQLEFVGRVYEVYSAYSSSIGRGVLCKHINGHAHLTNYRVLEPLESEECCESVDNPSITDIIANLARRVASLEQQLSATQGNLEKLAEELATVKYLVDSNEQDIAMLDERTQPTEEPVTPDESIPQYWAEALIKFYGGSR
jgi:uncharacterized coiled-coil protein SlyX